MPDEMPSREHRCCRLLKFTGEPRARPLTTAYDERREGRAATYWSLQPLSVVEADGGARGVQDAAAQGDEALVAARPAAGSARATPSCAPRPSDAGRVGPCSDAVAGDPVLNALIAPASDPALYVRPRLS